MIAAIKRQPLLWFFIAWVLLNLVQAASTQLLDDEAYYWVYSRHLDWGYFDHPPMIAFLIKLGFALFPNEFGVRLFMVLLNVATLLLIYRMLLVKNDKLFMALAASLAVLQIGGILAVPDIPLTFFTTLFLYQYQRFLSKNSFVQAMLLGVVMALLLYSKYHGILVIVFTVASNPRLALQPKAWLAVFTGLLLFSPHLWWQYQNGFPSVWYHLRERNAPEYHLAFTTEYLLGQIVFAGPFIGVGLYMAAIKTPGKDLFVRALKFISLGVVAFFAISTIKGRVEANWTAPVLVPLLLLAHYWFSARDNAVRWIYRLTLPTVAIILLVRLYMAVDIPFLNAMFHDEMHDNRSWSAAIKAKAGGLPVVFTNSYQRPSKYYFYTRDTAFGLNSTDYRRNLYNFSSIESQFQHRNILLVEPVSRVGCDSIPTAKGLYYSSRITDFRSWSGIRLQPVTLPLRAGRGQPFELLFTSSDSLQHVHAVLDVFEDNRLQQRIPLDVQHQKDSLYSSRVNITVAPGRYRAKLGIETSVPGLISQNSPTLTLEISQ